MERLRREGGYEDAILVEDQIDALRGNDNSRLRPFLATWGYVKEEWLRDPGGVPLLAPGEFPALLKSVMRSR